MIPIIPLAGLVGVFDGAQFWQSLATMFGAAAVYAQRRARRPELSEYEQVEQMVRQPVTWTMRHPVRAAVRLVKKADRLR